MITFNRILCPTDFSEASYKTLRSANDLSIQFAAELYIVHVIEDIPSLLIAASAVPGAIVTSKDITTSDVKSPNEELEVRKKLQELIVNQVSKEVTTHLVILHGNPAEKIIEVVEQNDIDLIVISTHGITGFKHFIFGSVVEKVIKTAQCPVLTIKILQKE